MNVCVIGAGPSGLVTARHLLECGLRPTILEASMEVGGLWRSTAGGGTTWNSLRTNLSSYTCCFSEHPWSSMLLQQQKQQQQQQQYRNAAALSFFYPTNQQVHEYLQSYSKRFLSLDESENEDTTNSMFRFGCHVTKVIPAAAVAGAPEQEQQQQRGYSVRWKNRKNGQDEEQVFDGVVVASGFFAQPAWPQCSSSSSLDSFTGVHLHSSQYQSPCDWMHNNNDNDSDPTTTTVAVCGSSFSGFEIAADIASQAESTTTTRVIHILPSVPWIVPRFVPNNNNHNNSFIPLDLAFYRRSGPFLKQEQQQQQTNTNTYERQKHEVMERLMGGRSVQRNVFVQEAGVDPDFMAQQSFMNPTTMPCYSCISDDYLTSVRQKRIELAPGRLVGCGDLNTLQVQTTTPTTTTTTNIPNVDVLISATGYTTQLESFLDTQTILEPCEYQPENQFAPLILCDDVYHPKVPRLAFVGMYRGPYFGVMELQARLAAFQLKQQILSGNITTNTNYEDEEAALLTVSRQIRNQAPQPQFPRPDVVGRMDALATRLKQLGDTSLGDAPHFCATPTGDIPVLPVQYQPDRALAQNVVNEMHTDLEALCGTQNPHHVTPILVRSMLGNYHFHRTLKHFSDGSVQTVSGTIQFSYQTNNNDQDHETMENKYILYREDGILEMPNGMKMDVFREYHYLINHDMGTLDIYFVEAGKRAHLFLSFLFEATSNNVWTARSDHLCIKDSYGAEFQIQMQGLAIQSMEMKYNVKGPAKDYQARTCLTPKQ